MKPLQIQGSRFASIEILIVIAIIAILCPPHVSDEETFATIVVVSPRLLPQPPATPPRQLPHPTIPAKNA